MQGSPPWGRGEPSRAVFLREVGIDIGPGQAAQDISSWVDAADRLVNTEWSAGFYCGAGLHAELLSGNINLQARIRLLFFSAIFKQVLAAWDGITFDKAFVGSIQSVQGLTLPPEVRESPTRLSMSDVTAAFAFDGWSRKITLFSRGSLVGKRGYHHDRPLLPEPPTSFVLYDRRCH
jgi:hypothetical protein